MADGQCMDLHVEPSGAKCWRLKYPVDGKSGCMPSACIRPCRCRPLGKKRAAIKDQIGGGLEPVHEKRRAKLAMWDVAVTER